MATMLDYDYHYPLTPIQSATHNVHPAFRNDPDLADIVNADQSTTTLVPPPRNPLRTAVKPLFSSSVKELNISSTSLNHTLDDTDDTTPDANIQDLAVADTPASPRSQRSSTAHTPTNWISSVKVHASTQLSYNKRSKPKEVGPNRLKTSSSLPSLSQQQARTVLTLTARTLSSLPCPPSLLSQSWTLFLRDLQSAAALSKSQKGLAIAVALAVPICSPIFNVVIGWSVWQYQTVKNVRRGLENGAAFEQQRGRESVESVVERWNERWRERGMRVDLEVGTRGKKAKGDKGKFRVVVTELEPHQPIDEGYGSGDEK